MSDADMDCPADTAEPFKVNEPADGKVDILTAKSVLLSPRASAKPKSLVVKTLGVSSSVVTALSTPLGASLTGVTLMVMVFGL